jgi:hypothetical protein
MQVPHILTDDASVAIETVLDEGRTVRAASFTILGWMKLSLLPLLKRAFTCDPLMQTMADDLERDVGIIGTVARLGDQAAAEILPLGLASLLRHTFAKWPFF